jgi:antitoxin ParD1/3/4
MNVSLTPELDKWINDKVKSGLYHSSSEVVREGLRLLIRQEEQRDAMRRELRTELLTGIQQLNSQKSEEFTRDVIDTIKSDARKKSGV